MGSGYEVVIVSDGVSRELGNNLIFNFVNHLSSVDSSLGDLFPNQTSSTCHMPPVLRPQSSYLSGNTRRVRTSPGNSEVMSLSILWRHLFTCGAYLSTQSLRKQRKEDTTADTLTRPWLFRRVSEGAVSAKKRARYTARQQS